LLAGLLNQLPGVWIGKETGFVPRLYEAGVEAVHEWEDRRLATLIDDVNSYLTTNRWVTLATLPGARRFWSETDTTGYAGLVRYVWSLDVAPDGRHVEIAGDQTPNYVLAMPLLEELFPDACYVHIVRDPRDVVASILPLRFGARSPGVAASDWNECVSGWWAAERRLPPERRCEVRYEDLVGDPLATLKRLAVFLDTAPPDLDGVESLPTDAHGLAGLAAHHARLGQPIDSHSVGRHVRDLSTRDRALVEAITFAGLVTYDYDLGPFRPSPVLEENALLMTRERLVDLRRRALGRVTRRWPR
jgi:hypothetical protein